MYFAVIIVLILPKEKEESRYISPDGKVNAILTFTTGGAMGRHYNSLYISPSREREHSFIMGNEETLVLTIDDGDLKDITWVDNECLTITHESGRLKMYQRNVTCCGSHIKIYDKEISPISTKLGKTTLTHKVLQLKTGILLNSKGDGLHLSVPPMPAIQSTAPPPAGIPEAFKKKPSSLYE